MIDMFLLRSGVTCIHFPLPHFIFSGLVNDGGSGSNPKLPARCYAISRTLYRN